jgi:hypothetical protein
MPEPLAQIARFDVSDRRRELAEFLFADPSFVDVKCIDMNNIKLVAWVLTTACFLWGPYLNVGIGFFADTQVAVALFVVVVLGWGHLKIMPRSIAILIGAFLFFSIYVLMFSLGGSSLQYVASLRMVRAAVVLAASWILALSAFRIWPHAADRIILRTLYFSTVLHGLLMFLQYLMPSFREALTVYTFASDGLDVNLRSRMPGLTTGGGSQLSVFQSLGVVLFPFCYAITHTLIGRLLLAGGLAVIAFSIVLAGRSGVYTCILFFPLALIIAAAQQRTGGFLKMLKGIVLISVLMVFTAGLAMLMDATLRQSKQGVDYEGYTFSRNLDMFLSEDEGFVKNQTVYQLYSNDLQFPQDARTLWFGDNSHLEHSEGSKGSSVRSLDSDIGYVRVLFGYGIVGSTFLYGSYIAMIAIMWNTRKQSKLLSHLGVLLIFITLFFNAKEVFIFTRIGWPMCCMVFAGALAEALVRSGFLEPRNAERRPQRSPYVPSLEQRIDLAGRSS